MSVTFTPGKPVGRAGHVPAVPQLGDHQIAGSDNILDLGRRANLNSKGEFWIGYGAHRHLLLPGIRASSITAPSRHTRYDTPRERQRM